MANNIGSLGVVLALDSAKFEMGVEKAKVKAKQFADKTQASFNVANETLQNLSTNLQGMNKTLTFMNRLNIGSLLPVHEMMQMTDAWTSMNNQLRHVTSSVEGFNRAQSDVIQIANASRSDLSSVTSIYTKISDSQDMLKVNGAQVARITETISKSLSLYARTAAEATSAQLQLGQALGSGKLQGDEYKSLRESASGLINELTRVMGVTRSELDQMATRGELTSDRLAQAFLKMSDGIDRSFDETTATIGQSFTVLSNAATQLVGEFSDATGVADGVAQSILFVAKHIDTFAKALAAAGVGYGVYALASTKTAASTLALTKSFYVASQQLRLSTIASIGLSKGLNIATVSATKLGVALRGLLFSPLGLAIGVSAAAFALLTMRQDENKGSLDRLGLSTKEYIAKLHELNSLQLNKERIKLLEDEKQELAAVQEARKTLDNLGGLKLRQEVKSSLDEILSDVSLTKDQMAESINVLITRLHDSGRISEEVFKRAVETADNYVSAVGKLTDTREGLNSINSLLAKGGSEASQFGQSLNSIGPPKGIEKWDEYLKKLTSARDIVGMNTRELARYRAIQEGANSVQAEMAGIVAGQEQAYKDLQQAVIDKDQKAIDAAKNNIAQLDIEQQKVALLAEQMASVMEMATAFAKHGVAADLQAGAYRLMNDHYAKLHENLTQSSESKAQTDKVVAYGQTLANQKGGNRRGGGGGSSSKESELQSLTKSLKEQVAVLGMTDLEAQKYKISLMQGSDAAKAYAVSLAETISRHKEEQETLKQNRMLLEEITVFRDKTMLPLDMMGWGDKAREQMNQVVGIREEYAQKRRQLEENQESESSRISDEAYQARLLALEEAESKKLAILEESFQRQKLLESNWALGATEALNNYAAETANIYASVGNLVGNAFQGMEDALLDFVMTGKLSFKEFANSIIKDMMRIFIQQQITGLFAQGLSGLFGGGGGSIAGGNFTSTPSWSLGKFATGGYVAGPGTGTSDSIPAMLSNGEFVINARATRQNLRLLEAINAGRQPVYRANGGIVGHVPTVPSLQSYREGGNQITVNISNHGSQPVAGNAKMTTDDVGNRVIDIMLFDLNSNGRYAQQLKQMRR